MQYVEIQTPKRLARIALGVTGFGRSHRYQFENTDLSGSEVWCAWSCNNFNNKLVDEDRHLYEEIRRRTGVGFFGEVFRDVVGMSGAERDGKLELVYASHATMDLEERHDVWVPKTGFYVPTCEGIFHDGTLIPLETVSSWQEAMTRWESAGLPPEMASWFSRPDAYNRWTLAVRTHGAPISNGGVGPFGILTGRNPKVLKCEDYGSRLAFPETVPLY